MRSPQSALNRKEKNVYRTAIGKMVAVASASVVGLLSNPAISQTGKPTHVERASGCDISKEHGIPTTASEMLQRFATALKEGSFLQPESFSPEALACVFGSYTFTSLPRRPPDLELLFTDAGLVSLSRPHYTGLRAGNVSIKHFEHGAVLFYVGASVRAADERFSIENMIRVLGEPSEVTDGQSHVPPMHGHIQQLGKRDGLKNARVHFNFNSGDQWSHSSFLTNEDGIVIEFEATGGRRQQ